MSEGQENPTVDLIRWTFTAQADRRAAIEGFLNEQGMDVHARADGSLVVLWDEPEGDPDDIIDEIWALNGEECEVTHEEYHRVELLAYQADAEDGDEAESAAA